MTSLEQQRLHSSSIDVELLSQSFHSQLTLDEQISSSSSWKDITQTLQNAAHTLKTGNMHCSTSFNLFDSMSALELMDPKMDSGMIMKNETPIVPVEFRLKYNQIEFEFNAAKDILATFDYLLQCEITWYAGQPLAQTLYTNIYMHPCVLENLLGQVEGIMDSSVAGTLRLVMAAYCAALALSSFSIRKDVIAADIFEEEDFSIASYNIDLSLGGNLTQARVLKLLDTACKRLQQVGKTKKRASTESYDPIHQNPDANAKLCSIFLFHLQYRQSWLRGIFDLTQQCAEGIDRARKHIHHTISALRSISDERVNMGDHFFDGNHVGVDKRISRLLSATTPPRDASLPDIDEALRLQIKLVDELYYVCCPENFDSLESLRRVLRYFSAKSPNIIPRSYMMLCLYAGEKVYGRYNYSSWLSASMISYGVPDILLTSAEGSTFAARCLKPVFETIRIHLHQPSRQRQRLEYMLEDWGILQQQAKALDETFVSEMQIPNVDYPRYFSGWAMEQGIALMIHYTALGLELELYDSFEYLYVYWYLDCLMSSRIQNLNIIAAFMEQLRKHTKAEEKPEITSGKKGKKKKKKTVSKDNNANDHFIIELNVLDMQRTIIRGICQFISALKLDGCLQPLTHRYGSIRLRFHYRFAAFRKMLYPTMLSFDDFENNSDYSKYEAKQVLHSAAECFKRCRGIMDTLNLNSTFTSKKVLQDEMQSLLKLSVANGVSVAQAGSTPCEKLKHENIRFDRSFHHVLPWIQLKSK